MENEDMISTKNPEPFVLHEEYFKPSERAPVLDDIEALLAGAVKLHEAHDFGHAVGLVYLALEKVRSV